MSFDYIALPPGMYKPCITVCKLCYTFAYDLSPFESGGEDHSDAKRDTRQPAIIRRLDRRRCSQGCLITGIKQGTM